MRGWAALLGVAILGAPLSTRADTPPSAWDRTRDPAAGERYRLHVLAEELMHAPGPPIRRFHEQNLERARSLLESASAATSPDVRLRFDLGEVYQDLGRNEEAIDVLNPALAMAPRDARSADAWLALAFAAAHLDRSQEELAGYDAFLALSVSAHPSETVVSNRAEALMRLERLDEAIAGYRNVIESMEHGGRPGTDYTVLVLARWGLAVALDRNHDAAASEHEASTAAAEDPDERIIGNQDDVFFVPKYERDWYYALGRTDHAKRETSPRLALKRWELVVRTWADYVQRAAPNERWVPLARAHLASAEVQKAAVSARVKAMGPEKPAPDRGSSLPFEVH